MLSDEATPRTKGKIFGFHRSMDMGAVLGPSLALLYLYFYPENYTFVLHCVHSWTFAIAATLLLKKKRTVPREATPLFSFLAISKSSMYRKVVIGL
jgi:hypothetical protein